nr:DUF2931 family protein [Pedobacter sp. ASV2]
MKKLFNLTLLIVLTSSLLACKQKKMDEKFQWEGGASSPANYPAEPVTVSFTAVDGTGGGTPSKPISETNTWGYNGISSGGSGEPKLLPVKLDIKWLSYAEDQFYEGSFTLPYDKMLALFQKGFEEWVQGDTTRHDNYNTITAGMAPGGTVVVWLAGGSYEVEVARFQAHKTKFDLNNFNYSLDPELEKPGEYSKFALGAEGIKYIKEHGTSLGLWDTYRERFNWHPVVRLDQSFKAEPNHLDLVYSNGESEALFLKSLIDNPFGRKARIKEIYIDWDITDPSTHEKKGFWLPIIFNEDEMLKAYAEVYGNDPQQQGELIVDIDRANRYYRCYLLTRGKKVELKKMQGVIATNN